MPDQVAIVQATTNHSTDIGIGRLVLIKNSEIVTCVIKASYSMAFGFQDETQKTLEYFLENFVRTFANWTPLEDLHCGEAPTLAVESEGCIYGDTGKTVVGCIHGHPTKVVIGLIRELKGVIQTFAARKFQFMSEPVRIAAMCK